MLSHAQLFVTLWTVACQVPLSTEFSRQEYWSGLPFPPPGDLPGPGIEPPSLVFPALAGDAGLTPGLGRSSGGGHSKPLQYSCLENSMDRGTWRATVYGVANESDTIYQLNM